MKYSKAFDRDFAFYMAHRQKFCFAGVEPPFVACAPAGMNAKECFFRWDSQGRLNPSSQPELVTALILCKKSINWHIKQWVEGFDDMLEPLSTYIAEFNNPPDWVIRALVGSLERHLLKRRRNPWCEVLR